MSLRCVDFKDPRNKKVLNRLASYFPTMSREVVKAYINSWSSENLKDDEDRFPTREELEEWIDKEKSTANTDSFKSDMEKISQSMNPITRRNRVNKITRMFSNRVTEALEEEKKRLNQRIDSTDDFLAKRELIDELKNLSRFKIIKSMTPSRIFKLVKEDFQVYLDATPEERYELELEYINSDRNNDLYPAALKEKIARMKAQRTAEAYQTVIDNWRILAEEACSNFAITEGVSMDINDDYIEEDENTDSKDETGVSQDDSKENKEEQSKEGWMVNVREVSSFSSLSNRVRRTISNIARLNRRNEQDKDDLGDTQYLEASYVHSVLIQSLRDMVTAEDMLPTLYKLAYKLGEDGKPLTYINRFNEEKRILGKLPWMDQIITALESDPRMFTSFYRAYRKDYLNYWIIKPKTLPDGSITYKTMSINKSEGTAFYFDGWRDNYEYGNILDEDSLYNKDGEIDTSKAKIGLETVNEILGKFPRESDREEEIKVVNDPETLDKLQKALRMLGISVDDDTLLKSINFQIDDARFPLTILPLLDNLRTIFYDINKGNDKIENGKPADLINIYGSAYNSIAEIINKVDEDAIESNVRQGDKMRYAHVNPSYATTLIKKFRGANYKQFIESEFKNVPWFYDSKHGWYNELIKDLYTDPEAREKLEHIVVLEFNRKEYAKWSKLDAMLVLINQFNSNPDNTSDGYTFYQIPMLSDSQSAEFIRCKRYVENYEEVIVDKFYNLVLQEINRIETVKKRYQQGDVDKIANYDIIKYGDKVSLGGAEFKFLPELNERRYNEKGEIDPEGQYTITKYKDTLGTESQKEEFLKREIKTLLEEKFEDAMFEYKEMGLLERVSEDEHARYVHFNKFSEEGVRSYLKNFFYNSMFAQSQIIQLMTTDLAYYKNLEDFQKRNKQDHAPAERLNTLATWNIGGKEVPVLPIDPKTGKPRMERVIYLKDFEAPSLSIDEIEEALKQFPALTDAERSVIISKYKEINVADAQAYRTLDSFRATQIMADMWSEEEETAYNHFKNGEWHARDFVVLWNTRKPFLYTQKNQSNQLKGEDEGLIRVPTQHKNSEMLLLTNAIFGEIFSTSPKLRALDRFMTENNIDVAEFESAVKDGKQGVYNINDATTEMEVYTALNEHVNDSNYVHEFDYNDYGIQTATPEHGIDALQLVGTQIRRLIGADINAYNDPDFKFKYGNKEWTVEQWFNYYNAVNVANVRLAFEAVDTKFSNIEEIEKELLREVRSNPRYGSDLKDALTLKVNPKTGKKEFTIPLDDPAQTLRIQSLLNSIIKSKITKQQIQGGALIQASAYGLKNEPKLIFEYEGKEVKMTKEEAAKSDKKLRLKCMECYMPCPTEELYNLLLDPETHELDINKKNEYGEYIVPRKYLEAIGYRVPTEDKYSMAPLRIIGFLPRQVGSVIILPRDITNIAGSDFDVDKMYVMFHTLNISKYDMRKARYYYEKEKSLTKETFEQFAKGRGELADEILETDVPFKEWFKIHKEEYKATTIRVNNFRFEPGVDPNNKMAIYESAKKQTKEQRDSLMIDLMYSVLTNSDTLGKFLNPGGFDNQKKTARIVTILNSMSLDNFKATYGSVETLKKMTVKELDGIVNRIKVKLNPLSPNTWVTLHQRNMAGAALIGIAANHNASHAIMQKTKLSVKDEYALTFNGNKYNSLHNILNEEGQYITRNVSGFLAAFVDNAKDPVAGDMNFNTTTADIAFTLLRLGVQVPTVGLVLSQPVVKEVVDIVNNDRLTIQEAINQVIDKYARLAGGESIMEVSTEKGINNYDFTDDDLAENILASHNPGNNSSNYSEATFFKNQLKVAYMFSKLNTLSSDLGKLTQATRADTQNGAAGPSIADDIIKIERVQDVLDDSEKDTYTLENVDFIGFNKSEKDIINSELPILQAFFTYGIESTNRFLSKYFPQYENTYQKIVKKFKEETKYNRLDVKTRNSIYNDIISYYLTQFPEFRDEFNGKKFTRTIKNKDGEEETIEISARDYYINDFPKEFDKFKTARPELNIFSFFNRLKAYVSADKYHATPTITFTNVGSITPTQKEQYIKDWTTLLYVNDQTKEIAKKLFIYNCFKGFGFSPSGFSHLASTILKLDNESYMRTLREVHGNFDSEADVFFEQYILNHLDNRQLVPDVSKSNGHLSIDDNPAGEIGSGTTSFSVTLADNSSHDMRQFAHPYKKTDEIVFHNFVHFNIKGRDIYFKLAETPVGATATYIKVQPLGLKNQFIEYQYGVPAEAMESVIGQAEDNGFVDPYAESNIESDDSNPNDVTRDSNYVSSLLDSFAGGPAVSAPRVSKEVSILDKLAPNNTDDYTGENYCGNSGQGYEFF